MIDLAEEFATMAARVTPAHDKALAARGVPLAWLQSWQVPARYGVARALVDRKAGTWQPHPNGVPMCVLPDQPLLDVTDPLWTLVPFAPDDLIAFRPGEPSKWWRRTADAVLINREAVEESTIRDVPLPVHTDPLAWMTARGRGVVVVDWGQHRLRLHLSGPPSLLCDTFKLAARLDRRFKTERREDSVPKLTLPEAEAAA